MITFWTHPGMPNIIFRSGLKGGKFHLTGWVKMSTGKKRRSITFNSFHVAKAFGWVKA